MRIHKRVYIYYKKWNTNQTPHKREKEFEINHSRIKFQPYHVFHTWLWANPLLPEFLSLEKTVITPADTLLVATLSQSWLHLVWKASSATACGWRHRSSGPPTACLEKRYGKAPGVMMQLCSILCLTCATLEPTSQRGRPETLLCYDTASVDFKEGWFPHCSIESPRQYL